MEAERPVQQLIALFVPELRGGGAQRVTLNLAKAFLRYGLRVDVVVGRAEGPLVSDLVPGARLIDLGSRRLARLLPSVTAYLRRERPVALLTTLQGANIIGPLARTLSRAKTRVVVREANTLAQTRRAERRLRVLLVEKVMQVAYRSADQIVANSQATADDLVRYGLAEPEHIRVIHNPLDIPRIQREALEPLDHPWFASNGPPVVLGIGRLVEQKDFATFLRAIAVLRTHRDVRGMILGEGSLRSTLEWMVDDLGLRDFVELPGFVSNPHRYMSRAAVFLLSSRWEGFGNVLVEALAVGTDVVSTDCPGGPREVLCDGSFGRLVPVGDAQAMARAIGLSLDDRADSARLRARAESFGIDIIAPRYLEALGIGEPGPMP